MLHVLLTGLPVLHALVRMDAAMERDRLLALEKERAKEEAKKRLVVNFGVPLGLYSSCKRSVSFRLDEGSTEDSSGHPRQVDFEITKQLFLQVCPKSLGKLSFTLQIKSADWS